MLILRATLYALFLLVTVIPYAFACLLWSPLPLHWRYKLTMGWPQLAAWGAKVICGIRWKVQGTENLPDGPAIVLSKHQSAWETLFCPLTCLGKSALFTNENCTASHFSAGGSLYSE